MHAETTVTTSPESADPFPWVESLDETVPRTIFGPEEDTPEEDDPARTDHPVPGGGRGPDEDRPDEDDVAGTDHPVPGAID